MNAETERVLAIPDATSASPAVSPGWRTALPLLVGALLAILALYWRTAESMVAIWTRSETFAHGFFILPATLFLVWLRRKEIGKLAPTPDYLGLILLGCAGVAWLVAAAGRVQVVQQFAMVAMIPACVIAITGRQVARALMFPLGFLFLGVPVGEALIQPLMEWTADFTVAALRLTGIPVFREGTFFTIPSGNWSVVEGCSGLRYLIASVTVGALYAYLNYWKPWKRALFVVLSIIVPIVANGMRAYMIVMIATLSDMKLALGVDHFIYGWVFFGLVMLLLFWIGSFWRDPPQRAAGAMPVAHLPVRDGSRAAVVGMTTVALAIAAVGPLYAAQWDREQLRFDAMPVLAAPVAVAGWVRMDAAAIPWRPRYRGATTTLFEVYRKDDRLVAVWVGYYLQQGQGSALVTSQNVMVEQKHPVWDNVGESNREEKLGAENMSVRQTQLRSTRQRLLIWDWYRIAEHDLTSPYLAKLLLARERLFGRGEDGAAIILATPYDESLDGAQQTLRQFARDMLPSIGTVLTQVEDAAHAKQ